MKLILIDAVISALGVSTGNAQQKQSKEKSAFNYDQCLAKARASGRAPAFAASDCTKRMNAHQGKK